jgi:acetyltransferase-like isoleucine patch superfamily enzyme
LALNSWAVGGTPVVWLDASAVPAGTAATPSSSVRRISPTRRGRLGVACGGASMIARSAVSRRVVTLAPEVRIIVQWASLLEGQRTDIRCLPRRPLRLRRVIPSLGRLVTFLRSVLDPRPWVHVARLVHFYNYSHVSQVRRATLGAGVKMAPNVSLRFGQRVEIGARTHVGAYCSLWAGSSSGRIILGEDALLGPEVYITASNYQLDPGIPIMSQARDEADVVIGRDVWLGARVIVLPGVTIGDGCVVGAGSVVTRSLEPGSIAVGAPAKVVGRRG